MIEVVFETHSISVDNERGVATGWLPGKLSERGKEFAKELGERRRSDRFDAIFTSDLERALQTVEIAFGDSNVPIHKDWRLRECNYGNLNGMSVDRLDSERASRINVPFPNGESYLQVVERVKDFLGDLAKHEVKKVLVVGHSATRWALDHCLNGVPLEGLVDRPFDWQEGWHYRYEDS